VLANQDPEASAHLTEVFARRGMHMLGGARAVKVSKTGSGVAVVLDDGRVVEGSHCLMAVGSIPNTQGIGLEHAGVELDERGYVRVDEHLRTTTPSIWAAGDVTGRGMVVHEAVRQGVLAATNAVLDADAVLPAQVSPVGSFTDPEYASVGMTEERARGAHDVTVVTVTFDGLPRPIIDGRPAGFCKLVVDRARRQSLGCHIVGERAVELAQVAATAMAAEMTVEQLARVPFSFPTYANALGRAAITAAADLDASQMWAVDLLDPDRAAIV
jgi:pyruvate/2-oxoglutarate dehydrogenase complex dihydrolipoamide dehydrogenase (E3) component